MSDARTLEIGVDAALEKARQGVLFVDVRERDEIAQLAFDVRDIVVMPLSEFEQRYAELPQDREMVMVCKGGGRSLKATRHLLANGYREVVNMDSGMIQWAQRGNPSKGAVAQASIGGCCSTQPSANDACCDAPRSNGQSCC
jgi:rhodanese-related sulfurtransferase